MGVKAKRRRMNADLIPADHVVRLAFKDLQTAWFVAKNCQGSLQVLRKYERQAWYF